MAPTTPTQIKKFVGNSMAPSVLERMKNKDESLTDQSLREASYSVSYAGLTRVSIYLHKKDYSRMMDCRVKPGNDE
jgi:hypothetical protein